MTTVMVPRPRLVCLTCKRESSRGAGSHRWDGGLRAEWHDVINPLWWLLRLSVAMDRSSYCCGGKLVAVEPGHNLDTLDGRHGRLR